MVVSPASKADRDRNPNLLRLPEAPFFLDRQRTPGRLFAEAKNTMANRVWLIQKIDAPPAPFPELSRAQALTARTRESYR
jgi:hypothetical protein